MTDRSARNLIALALIIVAILAGPSLMRQWGWSQGDSRPAPLEDGKLSDRVQVLETQVKYLRDDMNRYWRGRGYSIDNNGRPIGLPR